MGYKLITWAFDPLKKCNAYLNVSKLHEIVDTYIENCYGETKFGLNTGLLTERLQIEWWITSKRLEEKWMPDINTTFEQPFQITISEHNLPVLVEPYLFKPTEEGYEVPIPQLIQEMNNTDPHLALKWRLQIRKIMQTLFSEEYALLALRKTNEPVNYYQFVKKITIPLQSKGK